MPYNRRNIGLSDTSRLRYDVGPVTAGAANLGRVTMAASLAWLQEVRGADDRRAALIFMALGVAVIAASLLMAFGAWEYNRCKRPVIPLGDC